MNFYLQSLSFMNVLKIDQLIVNRFFKEVTIIDPCKIILTRLKRLQTT